MHVPTRLIVLVVAASLALARAESGCDALPACMASYAPVCDSRDTTHFSECHFRLARCKQPGLEMVASGVCCPAACPLVIDKVCGSDGETYNSPCELLRARCDGAKSTLRVASRGPCDVDCSAIQCTGKPHKPLCGSDYRTYDNECELQRAQCRSGDPEELSRSHDGPCVGGPPERASALTAEDEDAMPMFMPLELDDVGNDESDPYEDPEPESMKCPGASFAICATDGITYGNVCAFTAARRADESVQFASLGVCPEEDPYSASSDEGGERTGPVDHCAFECPAPRVYEPVCTTTGVVFPNKCAYVSALCRDLLLPAAHPDFCDPLVLPLA